MHFQLYVVQDTLLASGGPAGRQTHFDLATFQEQVKRLAISVRAPAVGSMPALWDTQ